MTDKEERIKEREEWCEKIRDSFLEIGETILKRRETV